MRRVANVHVRDVPAQTIETLRAAARRHRRSLNAEIVQALVDRAEREQRTADLLDRLEAGRRRWRDAFPGGFPEGLEPETVIRHDRGRDDIR